MVAGIVTNPGNLQGTRRGGWVRVRRGFSEHLAGALFGGRAFRSRFSCERGLLFFGKLDRQRGHGPSPMLMPSVYVQACDAQTAMNLAEKSRMSALSILLDRS